MIVNSQVLGQPVDSGREHRYLNFSGAGVVFVDLVFVSDGLLFGLSQSHLLGSLLSLTSLFSLVADCSTEHKQYQFP